MNKLKKLPEQRGALMEQLDALLGGAKTENRAFSDEENAEFDRLSDEVREIADDSRLKILNNVTGTQ